MKYIDVIERTLRDNGMSDCILDIDEFVGYCETKEVRRYADGKFTARILMPDGRFISQRKLRNHDESLMGHNRIADFLIREGLYESLSELLNAGFIRVNYPNLRLWRTCEPSRNEGGVR